MLARLRRLAPRSAVQHGVLLAQHFSSIPIIDVSPLTQPFSSTEAQQHAALALHEAARRVGFFYAANTGVPEQLSQDILLLARRWFSLPEATKQQIALSPERHFRGYQGLGANVTRYDGGFARDHHEGIDFYKDVPEDSQPSSRIHGPNQWPTQEPDFEATAREYVRQMLGLGHALMRGISMGMGVSRFPGQPSTPEESYWCQRILNYPVLPQEARSGVQQRDGDIDRSVQLSCGEHTDYGLLTIVNQQPDVTALQVKNSAGQWIDATPITGAFVCNIGDMLRIMSAGLYEPTPHRVINADSGKARTSVAFFYEPAFEALVEPAPELGAHRGAGLEPVCYGAHLEKKVLSNFEL